MARLSRSPKGKLGTTVARAIRNLRLTAQEVAVAARINKGTLSRILSGETARPHRSTLRRICKVLQLDFTTVAEVAQLELLVEVLEESGVLSDLETMLLAELRTLQPDELYQAADIAVWAIVDVRLGMGRGPGLQHLGFSGQETSAVVHDFVIRHLRDVPTVARHAAAQAAIGALTDFRIFRSAAPAQAAYRRATRLQRKLWSAFRETGAKYRSKTSSRDN